MEEVLTVRVSTEVQRKLNRTPEEMERDIRTYAALMLFSLLARARRWDDDLASLSG